MTAAEQVTSPESEHGEGPVWAEWSPGKAGLRYVDMLEGDVLSLDGDSVSRVHYGKVAAALRPRAQGGMAVALERDFTLVDPDGSTRSLGDLWGDDEGVRFNDGGTDPGGRFYCGSMAYAETPGAGSMWVLEPDGAIAKLWDNVTISNGMAWTPDGGTVYYIDTPTNRVDAFDYLPSGIQVDSRRTVVEISGQDGPDGMTVDSEGGLWVAIWGGSAVHHYSPDGTLQDVIEVAASQVTACTFGGADLDELYITTSRHGIADGAEPAAGAVFLARPGVRGLPALPFLG